MADVAIRVAEEIIGAVETATVEIETVETESAVAVAAKIEAAKIEMIEMINKVYEQYDQKFAEIKSAYDNDIIGSIRYNELAEANYKKCKKEEAEIRSNFKDFKKDLENDYIFKLECMIKSDL